jgi:hypothetical protein
MQLQTKWVAEMKEVEVEMTVDQEVEEMTAGLELVVKENRNKEEQTSNIKEK